DESACTGDENLALSVHPSRVPICRGFEPCRLTGKPVSNDRNLTPKQLLCPIVQSLDQTVGTARGDDRGKFVASCREVAYSSIEIDVDHSPAPDQVIDSHSTAARLQQPGLHNFTTTARLRCRIRVDDKAFTGIVLNLACIVGDDEFRESIA